MTRHLNDHYYYCWRYKVRSFWLIETKEKGRFLWTSHNNGGAWRQQSLSVLVLWWLSLNGAAGGSRPMIHTWPGRGAAEAEREGILMQRVRSYTCIINTASTPADSHTNTSNILSLWHAELGDTPALPTFSPCDMQRVRRYTCTSNILSLWHVELGDTPALSTFSPCDMQS